MKFAHHVFGSDEVLVIASQVNDGARVDQLQQVAVSGDDLDAQSLFGCPSRRGPKHIVRFEAFHLQARDVECIHHQADALDLGAQVFGHLGTRGFVFGKDLVAEGLAGVKCHCQVIRLFHLQDAQQFARKTVNSRRRFAGGGLPTLAGPASREGKIHAVGQCMAIN